MDKQFAEFEIHFWFPNENDHNISPSVAFALYDFIEELEKECKKKNIEIKILLDEKGGLKKRIVFVASIVSSILITTHLNYIQDITSGFWTEILGKDGKELGKTLAQKVQNIFKNASEDGKTTKIDAKITDNNKVIKQCSVERKNFNKYFLSEELNQKVKNKKFTYQTDNLEITPSGLIVVAKEAQCKIKQTEEYKSVFSQFNKNNQNSYEDDAYYKGSLFEKENN